MNSKLRKKKRKNKHFWNFSGTFWPLCDRFLFQWVSHEIQQVGIFYGFTLEALSSHNLSSFIFLLRNRFVHFYEIFTKNH